MILRGWKDVCAAVGGMSEDTARRLMREEGMPVSIVGGKPMSTTEALEAWVSKRCQGQNRPFRPDTSLADPIEADLPVSAENGGYALSQKGEHRHVNSKRGTDKPA